MQDVGQGRKDLVAPDFRQETRKEAETYENIGAVEREYGIGLGWRYRV